MPATMSAAPASWRAKTGSPRTSAAAATVVTGYMVEKIEAYALPTASMAM